MLFLVLVKRFECTCLSADVWHSRVQLYRYISGLWRHIERTITAENCLRYQFALSGGYGHLEPYSRGLAVKYEQDRKKLRNCMSLCALELTGAILTLQPDTRDEAYNRRRQSMPIMAWTIVHRLANSRMEAGMSPTAPWCGGLIVRTFPHVISSGRWEWQPDTDAVAGPFSKFVESAADGERLLLMAVDVRRNTSNDV